jgi:hypothetical protein
MESECERTRMDLDVKQTRRFYLAGTVAFPTPFPTVGGISIEDGSFQLPDDAKKGRNGEKNDKRTNGEEMETVPFVVVQENTGLQQATIRVVRESDVRAIFFPGVWVDTDKGRIFRFSEREYVHELEEGEWFLGPQINADEITRRLKLRERGKDITCRDSGVRGIVFVPEHRRVVTIHECALTAAETALEIRGNCIRGNCVSYWPSSY